MVRSLYPPLLEKPGDGRVDWQRPLAQGLALALLCHEGGGADAVDLVTGARATRSGTSASWVAGRSVAGPAVDLSGTGHLAGSTVADTPFTGAITLVWRGVLRATEPHFLGKHSSNGTTDSLFDFRGSGSGGSAQLYLGRANAGGRRVHRGGTTVLDAPRTYAVTAPSNLVEGVPTFYVGPVATTGTLDSGTATGAVLGSGAALRVGRRIDTAVQLNGVVELALAYSRALAQAEIAALDADPLGAILWQPRFWLVLGGPPIPVFQHSYRRRRAA